MIVGPLVGVVLLMALVVALVVAVRYNYIHTGILETSQEISFGSMFE